MNFIPDKPNYTYDYTDPESGLSFAEILMLFYANKYSTDMKNDLRFWEYKYGADIKNLISVLLRQNYIELDGIETSLQHLKIIELKKLLKKYNLQTKGNKNELILRLLENLTYDELDAEVPQRYYILTEKGVSVVQNNELILFAHRNPDFNIDIEKAKTYQNINDYLWSKFNMESLIYQAQEQWGLYRNCRLKMAEILSSEQRYNEALRFLIEVCYCDVLGFEEIERFVRVPRKQQIIAPGIQQKIFKIKDALHYSDERLKEEIAVYFETYNLPPVLCSTDKFVNLITGDLN